MTSLAQENIFNKVIPTAWLTAYPKKFTDIPLANEIFNELEKLKKENGEEKVASELKASRLAPELEARYKLVNKLLYQAGAMQILELASGLSSRGIVMAKDPSLEYVELDLPLMVETKRKILSKITEIPPNLHLEPGNALNFKTINQITKVFSKNKPLVVISEGLLRYLNFEEKAMVARNIHTLLEIFGGKWITPDITLKRFLRDQDEITMPGKNEKISRITGKNFEQNGFEDEKQAIEFFTKRGFSVKKHTLMEVMNDLVSPKNLGLENEEVRKMIASAVVFVMEITT